MGSPHRCHQLHTSFLQFSAHLQDTPARRATVAAKKDSAQAVPPTRLANNVKDTWAASRTHLQHSGMGIGTEPAQDGVGEAAVYWSFRTGSALLLLVLVALQLNRVLMRSRGIAVLSCRRARARGDSGSLWRRLCDGQDTAWELSWKPTTRCGDVLWRASMSVCIRWSTRVIMVASLPSGITACQGPYTLRERM